MTAATLLVMLKKIIIAIMLLQPLVFTSCGGDEPDAPDSGGTIDSGGGSEDNEGLDIVITGDTAPKGIQFRRINETDFMLNYVTYGIRDGHLNVIGCDDIEIIATLKGEVTLFSSITLDGKKYIVREIGKSAFSRCDLRKIEIPNTVERIGEWAFSRCDLRRIEIPNSVKIIGFSVFYGCANLEYCKLPNKLTIIPDSCFYGCSNLAAIDIPNTVTELHSYAFYGCSKLKNIIIPDSVELIGSCAFCGCVNLVTVVCGKSLSKINEKAFYRCTNLREFYFFSQNMPIFNDNSIGNIDAFYLSSYCLPEHYDNYLKMIGSGRVPYLHNEYQVYYYFIKEHLKTFDPKTLQL